MIYLILYKYIINLFYFLIIIIYRYLCFKLKKLNIISHFIMNKMNIMYNYTNIVLNKINIINETNF